MDKSIIESYPRYDSYKDSGEQWIGEIPSEWGILKLKQIFYEKKHTQNMNLSCGSISYGEVVRKNDDSIPESTKRSYQEVLEGEFLINPLNLNYDLISLRIALSEINVVVSAGYIVIKEHLPICRDYFKYLLHRYDVAYMKLLGSGVRQTINFNHISNSLLPVPSIDTQRKIASFLNKKTDEINRAIELKQQQISMLEEYKQIVIQNAVTKGLNPDVPMKDSGVDWIRDIPKHWQTNRLGIILNEVSTKNHPDLPLLSVTREKGVIKRDVNDYESNHNYIPDDLTGYKKIAKGQFGMNKMKAWQGSYGVSKYTGIISPAYYVFDISPELNKDFFSTAIRSRLYIDYFRSASDGVRIGQWDLNKVRMNAMVFVIPPIEEQVEIEAYLQNKFEQTDRLVAIKRQEIDSLTEYKTVLINEAVTGKIKVV